MVEEIEGDFKAGGTFDSGMRKKTVRASDEERKKLPQAKEMKTKPAGGTLDRQILKI